MSARSLMIVTLTAASFLAAAAASAQPGPAGPFPPEGPQGRGGPQGPGGPPGGVFISPAGEPFRSAGPAIPGERPGGAPPDRGGPPGHGLFRGPPPGAPSAPMAGGLVMQWFDQADANHDGALDRTEFLADGRRFFTTLDVDHDGRLSDREIGRYETEVAPEILPRVRQGPGEGMGEGPGPGRRRSRERGPGLDALEAGQAGGPPGGMPGGRGPPPGGMPGGRPGGEPYRPGASGAAQFGLLADPEPVRNADTDLDMRVTGEEWTAALTRRFQKLDRDGDGRLTLAELPRPGASAGPPPGAPPRRR